MIIRIVLGAILLNGLVLAFVYDEGGSDLTASVVLLSYLAAIGAVFGLVASLAAVKATELAPNQTSPVEVTPRKGKWRFVGRYWLASLPFMIIGLSVPSIMGRDTTAQVTVLVGAVAVILSALGALFLWRQQEKE